MDNSNKRSNTQSSFQNYNTYKKIDELNNEYEDNIEEQSLDHDKILIDKRYIKLSKEERQKDSLYDQLKNHKIDDMENYNNNEEEEEVENDKFEMSNNYNEYDNYNEENEEID